MSNDCAFCDRTKFEKRLITENNDWYVVATLGQITGGYVLLIPKEHTPCLGAIKSVRKFNDFSDMVHLVCGALRVEYKSDLSRLPIGLRRITAFEHGIVGQTVKHAHLHFLPAMIDFTKRVRRDFPKSEMDKMPFIHGLRGFYKQRREPYLFWANYDETVSTSMVCWNPPAPPQYLRLVAAEMLGRSERGNRRNMDPKLDKRLWQDTVARLKKRF